ncbi:glycosyltransferase family 2 protein [Leeuwenhoekiella sp. LLG6367-2.1]|uniref:glycosyltransferase family 2 protein n=1 Tax=Leeuwenhoekiella sp. LLG6367-2.1 TaxID=3160833 RepID=UPI00386F4AC2
MIVSIIIPTYNDWERLSLCIKALENQSFPFADFEIIVVNNDPNDLPPSVFQIPKNCVLISEGKPGSYAARNAALKIAKGEIIGFTDSDCIPDINWIKAAVNFLNSNLNVKRLTGPIEIFSEKEKPTLIEYHDFIYAFPKDPLSKSGTCVTANLFTYRKVFNIVGNFNSNTMSGGDIEWGIRSRDLGQKLVFTEKVIINHPARDTYTELFKKAKRVGLGQSIFFFKKITFIQILKSFVMIIRPKFWEWNKIKNYKTKIPLMYKIGVFIIRNLYLGTMDFYRSSALLKIYLKSKAF